MSRVQIQKATYDYSVLKPVIFGIMDSFVADRISSGSRVVIKPNFLSPAGPERAMVTHPLVLRIVSEYVVNKGCRPQISDSPAMGTFEKVLREGGYLEALSGLDVEFREFGNSVQVDIGPPFNRIDLAEDAVNADVVINLPKLKTHQQMLLTLGVKNLFGCVVGFRKPEWHFRTGVDREMFARLLVGIHSAIRPAVTIVDGILAMEGQGPGRSGSPRELGLIIGSDDSVASDFVIARGLGIDPVRVLTNHIALQNGYRPDRIELEGEFPRIRNFRFPETGGLVFGPKILHGLMRRHLVQRPEPDDDLCKLCGECRKICPMKAIEMKGKRITFDYDKCIRCYCCVEVCPLAALQAAETMPGKIIRNLIERRLRKR